MVKKRTPAQILRQVTAAHRQRLAARSSLLEPYLVLEDLCKLAAGYAEESVESMFEEQSFLQVGNEHETLRQRFAAKTVNLHCAPLQSFLEAVHSFYECSSQQMSLRCHFISLLGLCCRIRCYSSVPMRCRCGDPLNTVTVLAKRRRQQREAYLRRRNRRRLYK